jgi:hypothetical protein
MTPNANLISDEEVIPAGKILFRSITPLPECHAAHQTDSIQLLATGEQHGERYSVYLAYSNSWQQARSSVLKHWEDALFKDEKELFDFFAFPGKCNCFLVVDSLADSNEDTQCSFITPTLGEAQAAAVKALMLHHGGLGPYMEKTWTLRFPHRGVSRSYSQVSMNRSFCSSRPMVPATADGFETTFRYLLTTSLEDSQFGRVLTMALESISGSLRTTNTKHSLALLAIALEALFTEKEADFGTASFRISRVIGGNKGEVTDIHNRLNGNGNGNGHANCVREIRNAVMHGQVDWLTELVDAARLKLAGYLGLAIISLIQQADELSGADYYQSLASLVAKRFQSLPSK